MGSANEVGTAERALPASVLSDNLLDLFPSLVEHLHRREVMLIPGAEGAELDYTRLP